MGATPAGLAWAATNHSQPGEAAEDLSNEPEWPQLQPHPQDQRSRQKVTDKVRPKGRAASDKIAVRPIVATRVFSRGGRASPLRKPAACLTKCLLSALLGALILGAREGCCQPAGVRGSWAAASGESELSLDNQGLKSIPSQQLCSLAGDRLSKLNVASFANNQIGRLEPNAFACIAPMLKILILKHNQIELISEAAFAQLELVQVLELDDNQLQTVPSKEALRPLKSLRHLSLANNKIERLDEHAFGSHSASLISLNLKGNPLQRVAPSSLSSLVKLKTLTLSQSALSGPAPILLGLAELRFLHLDRAANLSSVGQDLCSGSRKLTALVLKSNRLERVPQFANCQPLLQLDLSYNRIRGSLSENFSRQASLIDLYLGHNLLTSVDEHAFAGLTSLQVLELSNNQLVSVHQRAFVPVGSTLYELSIANNPELRQLGSLGLQRLVSLKAFGNEQLRDLPHFESASSLALTYAYHCCEYLDSARPSLWALGEQNVTGPQRAPGTMLRAALARIGRLFGGERDDHADPAEAAARERPASSGQQLGGSAGSLATALERDGGDDVEKLTDLVLWPPSWPGRAQSGLARSPAAADSSPGSSRAAPDGNQLRRRRAASDDADPPRVGAGAAPGHQQQQLEQQRGQQQPDGCRPARRASGRGGRLERRPDKSRGSRVIDGLLWQAKQIRRAHSVGAALASVVGEEAEHAGSARPAQLIEWWDDAERPPLSSGRRAEASAAGGGTSDEDSSDEGQLDRNLRSALQVERPPRRLWRRQLATSAREDWRERDGAGRQTASSQSPSPKKPAAATAAAPVQCRPQPNAFLPCRDLFDTWPLRAGIWFVFVVAFAGNILVILVLGFVRQSSSASALTSIMWLAHSKRHIDVPRFLVINLAVADLLMALYLGLLAAVDLGTLGQFRVFAIQWQYSAGCKLAGFLGVLSSELSVFILAIITLERNYAITNAVHLNRRLSLQKAMLIMLLGYAFALSMALMPLNGISDYRKFSICLPLDVESSLAAQLYVATLVGINAFSFVLLLSCYLRMYFAIRGSQAWNTNDLRIAKRMSILVLTDFLCWVPIIVVASAALFGHHLVGTQGLKTLTIFVLPLNSIANPFLYAITTKKFKRDLDTLMRRIRAVAGPLSHYCRQPCCCCSSSSKSKLAAHQQGAANNNVNHDNYYSSAVGRLQLNSQRHYLHQNLAIRGAGGGLKSHQQLAGGQRAARAAGRNGASPSGPQCSSRSNQASMNRRAGACSCQRAQHSNAPSSEPPTERADARQSRQQQQQHPERRQRLHLQPRIVLDGVEPAEWSRTCLEDDATEPSPALIGKSPSATNSAALLDSDRQHQHQHPVLAATEPADSGAARKQVASRCMVRHLPSSSSSLHTDRDVDHCHGDNPDGGALTRDNNGRLARGSAPTLPPKRASSSSQLSPPGSARAARRPLPTRPPTDGRDQSALARGPRCPARGAAQSCLGRSSSATVATAMAAAAATVMASSCQAIIVDQAAAAGAACAGCSRSGSANVNFNKQQKQSRRFLSVMGPAQAAVDLRSASACGRYRSSRSDPSSGQEDEGADHGEGKRRAARNTAASCRLVSGSCEAMKPLSNRQAERSRDHYQHHLHRHQQRHHQHEPLRSREKLSQSISRLLFGPIAKAWSSIQISLNSSATHMGAARSSSASPNLDDSNRNISAGGGLLQQRQRARARCVGSGPIDCDCADSLSSGEGPPFIGCQNQADNNDNRDAKKNEMRREAPASTAASDLLTKQNSTTVEDILLLSSPSNHFYKYGERRMSRSCDMIPQQQQYFLTSPTNSSGGAYELTTTTATTTTTTSHDDDRRILLATINRIAGARRRHGDRKGAQQKRMADNEGINNTSNQYLRSKCAKCRSWSPALLSKLEDCIYQIKSKIPRLNAAQIDAGQAHEAMQQIESSDDNQLRLSFDYSEDDDDDEMDCEAANAASCSGDCGGSRGVKKTTPCGGACETTGGNRRPTSLIMARDHDEDDDDDDREADCDDDKFNEGGLLEWSERRKAMVRRGHLLRKHSVKLQKQSSANSDTLSTRTAGTIVTNMSASFDSETGIPTLLFQQPQQTASQQQESFVANHNADNV